MVRARVVVFVVERAVEAVLAANAASHPRIYADIPKPSGLGQALAPVEPTVPVFKF